MQCALKLKYAPDNVMRLMKSLSPAEEEKENFLASMCLHYEIFLFSFSF